MKKSLIVMGICLIICGCTNVKNISFDDILNTISTYKERPNTYRSGYKYYLPRDLNVEDSTLFNEILSNGQENYYLYVDAVSFNKKIKVGYNVNKKSYFSTAINYDDKYGYLEINLKENKKYLIEIMYNYAKIEVMVDKDRINNALLTCVNILKSISYNDAIIANLFGNDILNYTEEEFNIFSTTSEDSTYLQRDDTYQEEVEDETLPDTDLIN